MDNNSYSNIFNKDPKELIGNPLNFDNAIKAPTDPLALDIPDIELVQIIEQRVHASEEFFEKRYNLKKRRRKNEQMVFGRQLEEKLRNRQLKDYETKSSDNALYEIESSLKPLAMSKLPDIIVTPGNDDPERQESADNLTLAIDDMTKKREQREVLGIAFKHMPIYFIAVIKAKWNPEIGKYGDSEFINVNPEYIVVDHTATNKNADDISMVAQCTPTTVQDLIMKFPKKKNEIFESAKIQSVMAGENPTYKDLATEVKPWEIWFDWYKRKGTKDLLTKTEMMSIDEPGVKWERVSGLIWKFNNIILDKMLDPNYDHAGEEKVYSYAVPGDETTKQEVNPQDLLIGQLLGQEIPGLTTEKIYHNYFDRPHKPYYFMGYDQFGKIVYDETSRVEQNLRNQENLDDQNKQILDTIKKRVKHIWSKDSGMDKATVQRLDLDDPKMDVLVEGMPGNVHAEVKPERPDAAQFNALGDTRSRMYAISGSNAIRGSLQSDVATTNQIAREADYTRTDDLVEDTINAACEWMAQWRMQFIKLRYTEDHMVQIMGAKGKMTYVKLRRDTIEDGMEVMVKSSSTDKLKAQRNALEMAKLGAPFTDPINLFKDIGMSDPEERAEMGIMFAQDPQGYFTKYILKLDDSQAQIGALTAGLPGQAPGQESSIPPAPTAGAPSPQIPTATDTTQVPAAPPIGPAQGSPRAL